MHEKGAVRICAPSGSLTFDPNRQLAPWRELMGGPLSAHVCGLPSSTSRPVKSISLADHNPAGGAKVTDGGGI